MPGLFGGSSSSQSSTSTDKSTKIETNTTTRIRDIGLTGDSAIELAGLLEEGILAQTDAVANLIDPVLRTAQIQSLGAKLTNSEALALLSPEAQLANIELKKSPSQILAGKSPLLIIGIAGVLGFVAFKFRK